jgi:hypothetical protein
MDSTGNARPQPESNRFYEGVIVGTASDPADVLMVTLDRFDRDAPFGDPGGVVWTAHEGPAYPSDGDWCLAVESDAGTWVVLAWKAT